MSIDKAKLAEYVVKLQHGDGHAFEQIYNMTLKRAKFMAEKIVGPDDADDVLQEAYIKVLEKINTVEDPDSFLSWFDMIVSNRAKDYYRKVQKERGRSTDLYFSDEEGNEASALDFVEEEDALFIPDASVEQDDLRHEVMNLINGLSDEKRTAVLLYYFNDLSVKQIAESLEVSENTVKTHLARARKQLAEGVKELQKKNKILGIAPMSLVRWALKGSGDAVAEKNLQDMQQLFTKLQESYPHTGLSFFEKLKFNLTEFFGNIGTKFQGAGDKGVDLKPVAAIVVTAGIVGGAVAGTNAVKNRNKADETTTAAVTQEKETQAETTKKVSVPVTIPEYKNVENYIEKEELKYGVTRTSENFAVRQDGGTGVVEGTSYLVRSGYSATYEDLLPAAQENAAAYSSQRSSIVSSINELRSEAGLDALTEDDILTEQANVRAEEIAWSGRNGSIRPDGSDYTTIFEHNGLDSGTRLEIRVAGYTSAADAIKVISQNDDIKNADIEKIGVGVSQNPETETLVYVVHLYSDEGYTSGVSNIIDRLRFNRQNSAGEAQEDLDNSLSEYEEFKERISSVPVLGDIYYVVSGDWAEGAIMAASGPFNDIMDDFYEAAEKSTNGR